MYSWCAGSLRGYRHHLHGNPQDRSLRQPQCSPARLVRAGVQSTSPRTWQAHGLGLSCLCFTISCQQASSQNQDGKTFWLLLYKVYIQVLRCVCMYTHTEKFLKYFTPIYGFLALQLSAQCIQYIHLQHP